MDPVLGDYDARGEGRLYVAAELVEPMRAHVRAARVDLLTPNAFEAETLARAPRIADARGALAAIDALHALGARSVVMTSTFVPAAGAAAPAADDAFLVFASAPWADVADECGSVVDAEGGGGFGGGGFGGGFGGGGGAPAGRARLWPRGARAAPHARFAVRVPRLAGSFSGAGDVLAALLLAHAGGARRGGLVGAVEAALASTFALCARTARGRARAAARGGVAAAAAAAGADAAAAARAAAAASAELRLVESRDDFARPEVRQGMHAFALNEEGERDA